MTENIHPMTDIIPIPSPREHAIMTYNEAVTAAQTDKTISYRMLCAAADIDPTFKEAWYAVSNACGDMNLLPAAVAGARRTLEIDPLDAKAMVNIGHRLYHMGRIAEAKKFTERAVEINEDLPFGWSNLAMIESILGNDKKSLSLARRAYALDPDDCTIEMQLAFSLLFAGKWMEGLERLESRFPYKLNAAGGYAHYPYPRWDGSLTNTLLVVSDQGIGDSICYMRFVPAAAQRCKRLILAVHPEAVRMFRAMLQEYENVEVVALPIAFPTANAWCPFTSLPLALGLTDAEYEAAPWLPMPGFKETSQWKAPDRKLHIGICWSGNAANDIDRWRSMNPEQFLELYRCPDIQLYSLQVGQQQVEKLHLTGCASVIKDLSPYIRDVASTVGLIDHLDMLICIESMVAWLGAACDKETWVLYSHNGRDFRCGNHRKHPLWAPKTRLFKQTDQAFWLPVFDEVVEALKEKVNAIA